MMLNLFGVQLRMKLDVSSVEPEMDGVSRISGYIQDSARVTMKVASAEARTDIGNEWELHTSRRRRRKSIRWRDR